MLAMRGTSTASKLRGVMSRPDVLNTQLRATIMCTLSCCEIICRKTRESSPVPSGDNRRSVSSTVGWAMSKTEPPSTPAESAARGPRGPHAEAELHRHPLRAHRQQGPHFLRADAGGEGLLRKLNLPLSRERSQQKR
eukprot:661463-Pleurochrysis_carterae.AAC.9